MVKELFQGSFGPTAGFLSKKLHLDCGLERGSDGNHWLLAGTLRAQRRGATLRETHNLDCNQRQIYMNAHQPAVQCALDACRPRLPRGSLVVTGRYVGEAQDSRVSEKSGARCS